MRIPGSAVRVLLFAGVLVVAAPAGFAEPPETTDGIRSIVYGGDADFAPYEYLDRLGRPAGLNVELIRAVARTKGLSVRVELRPWKETRAALQDGRIDVAAMYRSPQRAREVDFAIPHELIYHELYTRRGAPPIRSLADLAGKRILVETDTYSADALTELGYGSQLRLEPSEPAVLAALASGGGDVGLVTQTAERPFLKRAAVTKGLVVAGPPVLLTEYGFVTRKGRRALIELLNEGVAAVKASGEYDAIYDRTVRTDRSEGVLRAIGIALGAATLGLLLFFAWTLSLRRQVARQTAALRSEYAARERAQLALAQSEENLRHAQKMEAVGRLATGVAHDFNNILTVIVAWASLLRQESSRDGRATNEVDEILVAAERASRLTRQLLAFSRRAPLQVARVDVAAIVNGLRRMLQRLAGASIETDVTVPPEPLVIDADQTLIEQILLNLAANARDAMPRGGRLTIVAEACVLAENNPWSLPPGGYARLLVRDTGSGMDEATASRIFEPFFTTKDERGGTGLGLAIVHANVTKLGGAVSVETEPGDGTQFTILLPRDTAAAADEGRPGNAGQPPVAAHAETILLVDDDEAVRRVARIALEQAGHRVLEAADGEQAERLAAANPITLLVTDVVMPKLSGPQLAANLRQRMPGLRVLFVSGYVQAVESLSVGGADTAFLSKPYETSALVEAVRALATAKA